MNLFDKLNNKQCEAVRTTEGYVRVIAGAGSGKTKLLVSRYAYLVREYGIDSANILCVTFTNKAAGEMKRRIRALIGPEYDTSLICTYHGFCARLLRENPEKLFFSKGFQIFDPSQQKAILEGIYQKHELKLDYASFESILKKIELFKNTTDYVPRFCNPKPCQILPEISDQDDQIIEEFIQCQKAMYALDFSDLMNFALFLLENDDQIREKWQDRLNYIQVDEFQDSSKKELKLVDILSGKYNNLMIVGDPDQNIYEWRGSDVKLLVDFDKTHHPTETVFLNQNYRSTPQILRCANHLIEKNELRLKKDLFTKTANGAAVLHYHSKSNDEENNTIVENIRSLKKTNGYTFSDFAVLYRSGFLSRVIEKKFVESNIPYEIYGGVKFYQRMEILDIIAYLRLIAFDDDVSFRRIVNTPRRKFGRQKMSYLETLRDSTMSLFDDGSGNSLFSALKNNLNESAFKASEAREFISFIISMRRIVPTARISEIVNRVTAESGYEQYIRELGDEERLENLAEFKRIANEFERSFGEELTLEEFLQQIALLSSEDEEKNNDTVKLMTIHSAKGLEFPVVFIVGFTEGIFPSSKTIEERKKLGLEEERRLCYVAITRAKEHLFLMDSEGMSEKGIKKLPSRFLDEIGEDNYSRIGKISDDLKSEAYGYIMRTTPATEQQMPGLTVGEDVEHPGFGHGTIVGINEKRGSFIIMFDKLSQTRNISRDFFDKAHTLSLSDPGTETDVLSDAGIKTEDGFVDMILYHDVSVGGSDPAADRISGKTGEPYPCSPDTGIGAGGDTEDAPTYVEENADNRYNAIRKDGETPGAEVGTEPDRIPVEELEEIERFIEEEMTDPEIRLSGEASFISGATYPNEEKNVIDRGNAVSVPKSRPEKSLRSDNLWKRDDVPHTGWTCVGVTDLGEPSCICEMCGYQIIRYVHSMVHPGFRKLDVGCICAGKMEGDIDAAKERERDFKNRQTRLVNFKRRKWKQSYNGNPYAKIKEHLVVLYKIKNSSNWKYSIDNKFCAEIFESRDEVSEAAFEALDKIINKK